MKPSTRRDLFWLIGRLVGCLACLFWLALCAALFTWLIVTVAHHA